MVPLRAHRTDVAQEVCRSVRCVAVFVEDSLGRAKMACSFSAIDQKAVDSSKWNGIKQRAVCRELSWS